MQSMTSTLPVGPHDWNSSAQPESEFLDRLNRLMAATEADGAVVFGDNANHAELAYFTNVIPKLGPTILLAAESGERTILASGGQNMLGPARRMTPIKDVRPLAADPESVISEWLASLKAEGRPRVALVGADYATERPHGLLTKALAGARVTDAADALRPQMLRKSETEIAAIRGAVGMIEKALAAMRDAHADGKAATDTLAVGEQATGAAGAQETRTLFSLDGGQTLRPFEFKRPDRPDPLPVYLAVRHLGYWAEAFVTLSTGPHAADRADAALKVIVDEIRPGLAFAEVRRIAEAQGAQHPIALSEPVSAIGLSLDDPAAMGDPVFRDGGVYSVRAGVADSAGSTLTSAMLRVTGDGAEILWL